jgi:effector-binding domain-containing protein
MARLRTRPVSLALAALSLGAVAACTGPPTNAQVGVDPPAAFKTFTPDLPTSHPPYDEFYASWVLRSDTPYVYMEHYGSYTTTGAHLPALMREMRVQGIEASGPPFCLFYDDPAVVPRDQLVSRACVPIDTPRSPRSPLRYDVLPSKNVVYAFVSGPYPDVPRAYPKLLDHMAQLNPNWVVDGPIRETYLVPPSQAARPEDYLCWIEVPFTFGQ